jgi:hypothetical protein
VYNPIYVLICSGSDYSTSGNSNLICYQMYDGVSHGDYAILVRVVGDMQQVHPPRKGPKERQCSLSIDDEAPKDRHDGGRRKTERTNRQTAT